MKKKLSLKQAEKLLKQKTFFFAMYDCENKNHYLYQSIYLPLKKLCKKIILFDTKKQNLKHGPYLMKKELLDSIKKNKPDFVLFSVWGCGEFESIDLPEEINKVSPESKIISLLGDDDRDYEISSRYYAPFMDYNLVPQADYVPRYKKEGYKAFPFYIIDTANFKPSNLKKKYDVSFIGSPNELRANLMRFLIKNKVKINIFGSGWLAYPEFKDYYHGTLDPKEFVKVISQSKINLGFSHNEFGEPHFKGRVIEFGAIKSFTLVDYFTGYLLYLKENRDIVMFKDLNELLKKIKYYLKHEKEREKIAENAYKAVFKNNDFRLETIKIFREIFLDSKKPRPKHKLNKKIFKISDSDLNKERKSLKKILKNYDYISFHNEKHKYHKYKDYLQVLSLEKTGKNISCCDYYLHFNNSGNYLRFRPFRAIRTIKKSEFNKLLNLSQIMVSKGYFLMNLEKFRSFNNDRELDFINEKNTAFIDIPLVKIQALPKVNQDGIKNLPLSSLEKAFQLNFLVRLYTLAYQKKILSNPYFYKLALFPMMKGNTAILKYLFNAAFNKDNWLRFKSLNE